MRCRSVIGVQIDIRPAFFTTDHGLRLFLFSSSKIVLVETKSERLCSWLKMFVKQPGCGRRVKVQK